MANLVDIFAEAGAALVGDDAVATLRVENTSTGNALNLLAAGATTALMNLVVSGASGANFKFNNIGRGFVSTNSTASLAYAFKVTIDGGANGDYWVPVYTGKA